MSLILSKIEGGEIELTEHDLRHVTMTDAELDAVTGGTEISFLAKLQNALHDMRKALIENYRV
jgi:hypothetical protein